MTWEVLAELVTVPLDVGLVSWCPICISPLEVVAMPVPVGWDLDGSGGGMGYPWLAGSVQPGLVLVESGEGRLPMGTMGGRVGGFKRVLLSSASGGW